MIEVFPETKIYILAPSDYVTGGVECLHQLSDKLIKLGYNAFLYYIPKTKLGVVKEYKNYKVNKVEKIEDDKKNIIIIPETWIDKVNKFHKIRKCIYWLSVDNVKRTTTLPIGRINKKIPFFRKNFPKIYEKLKELYSKFNKKGKILFDFNDVKNKEIFHLAQSDYAKNFLEQKKVKKIYMLGDYLNKEHFVKKNIKKEDLVAYNPKKGKKITKRIINYSKDIKYVALENMTPEEVSITLKRCKVYIDFGEHPGKDRLPREAALNDCCIIVGGVGSAKFYKDMPIKKEYKFKINPVDLRKVVRKIKECLINYESKIKDFRDYKKMIMKEEEIFEKQIKNIFKKV